MKAKRAANSKAAMQQNQLAAAQAKSQQQFSQKSQLENQQSDNRIKRDLVVASAKANGLEEATEGMPSTGGLEGMQPSVV